jgi:hypothetical protein
MLSARFEVIEKVELEGETLPEDTARSVTGSG